MEDLHDSREQALKDGLVQVTSLHEVTSTNLTEHPQCKRVYSKAGNTEIVTPNIYYRRKVRKAPGDGVTHWEVQLDHFQIVSVDWLQEQIDAGNVWKYPSDVDIWY